MAESKAADMIRLEELDDGTVQVVGVRDEDDLETEAPVSVDGDDGQSEGDEGAGGTEGSDDGRASRNKERRQRQKEARDRKEAEIAALKAEVAEAKRLVSERLAGIEANNVGNQVAQLDNRLRELDQTETYARQKHRQAISDSDGVVADEALTVLHRIQAERNQALAYREQMLGQVNQFRAMQEHLANNPSPAEMVQPETFSDLATAHAQTWARQNPWFVPGGQDPDSRIAMNVETRLYAEGSSPEDPEHWERLNAELKRHLPHRFNGSSGRRGPMVGGASEYLGGTNGRGTVTLPKAFVDGLKDAGIWDNADLRNKAIKNYRAGLQKR